MSGFLKQVTKGKQQQPVLTIIYGPDGVGKSTFGANAPSPIFLGTEDGTANLDVARFPHPKSFNEVRSMIKELIESKHDFKTLVIDSLDWLETLVHQAVMDLDGSTTINRAQGGYGNGILMAVKYWVAMQEDLKALRKEKGMNIILIAHSQVKTFNDPTQNAAYDRYQLKLDDKGAAKWREFVDSVLFATYDTVAKAEKGDKKAKTYGGENRVIFTERRPSFDAKNRHGLPFEMPLDWGIFYEHYMRGESADSILNELRKTVLEIKDDQTREKTIEAIKAAGQDADRLAVIRNNVRTIVELNQQQQQ